MKSNVINFAQRMSERRLRRSKARGEMTDEQYEAISHLMRKLLKSKEAANIAEAYEMAVSRLFP